jgi:shikimate dehydrogenase
MIEITGSTKIFGVIADPIDHVRAPMVFNPIFERRGIDAVMLPLHIRPHQLEISIRGLADLANMGGVCVTIPHKMKMAELCDDLGLVAQLTGAVNAVRFENGRFIGDNFDGEGFVSGLLGEGHDLSEKNILMIGAGGAARAIAVMLAKQPIASLNIANRTIDKARSIADILTLHHPRLEVSAATLDEIPSVIGKADILINTTSLGLHDGDSLPCALEGARPDALAADIIMIPAITSWLKKAEEKGLKIHPGKHMLDYQCNLIGKFIGAW